MRLNNNSFRIVLIYFVAGALWITLTDKLIFSTVLSQNLQHLLTNSILKGLLFLLITASLLYYVLKRSQATIQKQFDEIQTSYERYELLTEATNETIYDWEFNTDHLHWNKGLNEVFGYPKSDNHVNLDWWSQRLHPLDYETVIDSLQIAIKNKHRFWSCNYRFKTKSGEYKRVLDRGVILYDKHVEPTRMIGSLQDLDPQFQANLEIYKLSAVAESVNNLVVIADPSANIVWVNEAFEKVTGRRLIDVINRPITDIPPLSPLEFEDLDMLRQQLLNQDSFTFEVQNKRNRGEDYWLQVNCSPLLNKEEQFLGFILIGIEITDRVQKELMMEKHNQILSEIAFISSHDIRRPVASILGLLNLIKEMPDDNEERKHYVYLIEVCSFELDTMIHQIVSKARDL